MKSNALPRNEEQRRRFDRILETAAIRPNEMTRLRSLLRGDDRDDVDRLRARLKVLEAAFESDTLWRDRVADTLLDSMGEVGSERRDEFAAVLSPLMAEGMRHEIANSKEQMVAALYPITGRLVSAAVSDAFGRLVHDINARIEAMFSRRSWALRFKSLVSGKSIAEIALADATQGEVVRFYLIEQSSGGVDFVWPSEEAGPPLKDDVANALASAVDAIARDARKGAGAGVRRIVLPDSHLILQASGEKIAAVEANGPLSRPRISDLSAVCLSFLEFAAAHSDNNRTAVDADAMGMFAQRLAQQSRPESRSAINPVLMLAAAAGLLLVGFLGWRAYGVHQLGAAETRVQAMIEAAPALDGMPIDVKSDRNAGLIRVSGLAAPLTDIDALKTRLAEAAQPYDALIRIAPLDPSAMERHQLEADLSAAHNLIATLQSEIARSDREMRLLSSETRASLEGLLADPAVALRSWMQENAVFFAGKDAFRSPDTAAAQLDALATLMLATPGRAVRVVGHADGLGERAVNIEVASRRAEKVVAELTRRGVPPALLLAVGVQDPYHISGANGPESPNRRVEFHPMFVAE